MNISTKYNINDEFYIIDDNQIKKAIIKGITIHIDGCNNKGESPFKKDISYRLVFRIRPESNIIGSIQVSDEDEGVKFFITKEKLVQSLLEEEKDAGIPFDNIDDDEDW